MNRIKGRTIKFIRVLHESTLNGIRAHCHACINAHTACIYTRQRGFGTISVFYTRRRLALSLSISLLFGFGWWIFVSFMEQKVFRIYFIYIFFN